MLAASLVWLVGTTLCSTGISRKPNDHCDADSEEHSLSHQDGDHHHDSGNSDHQSDQDSSCCGSIRVDSAQMISADLMPLILPCFGHFWLLDTTFAEAQLGGFSSPDVDCSTGPPGVVSFAKHFLQRCLLSQAPPIVA